MRKWGRVERGGRGDGVGKSGERKESGGGGESGEEW